MTGPNLFDALASQQIVKGKSIVDKGSSKGGDSAFIFSELMNNAGGSNTVDNNSIKLHDFNSDNQYQKYQLNKKDNPIKIDDSNPIKEKVDASQKKIDGFKKEIVEAVTEKLDISEEELENVLEQLGHVVFDLLNPEILTEVVSELRGIEDASMLILDDSFQTVLSDVSSIGKDMMKELELGQDGLQELVSYMEILEKPMTIEELDTNVSEIIVDDVVTLDFSEEVKASNDVIVGQQNESANGETMNEVVDNTTTDSNGESGEDNQSELREDEMVMTSSLDNDKRKSSVTNSFAHIQNQYTNVSNEVNNVNSVSEVDNYLSAETMDIIEQIVDNARVTINSDTTTMELQLNPENLGRVYLNISSKEGNVNAQFTVTNEIVKEALEAQLVNLRENLNQAGVKVDAVEVTVASHEFERNLDQNHSREEQEGARQEELQRRRNINLSSLDDLSGIMSEEEMLVAQMMRDNGNSVDLTA